MEHSNVGHRWCTPPDGRLERKPAGICVGTNVLDRTRKSKVYYMAHQ